MRKILAATFMLAFMAVGAFAHEVKGDRDHNMQHLKEGVNERQGQIFCMDYETWKNEFEEPKGLFVQYFENLEARENDPVVRARAVFLSANRKELFAVILTKTDDVCLVFSMLNMERAN